MAMDFLARNWALASNSPFLAKNKEAIRFGLLGASKIAPSSIIAPAKSCADVVISAVAARDVERAKVFAKKWGIERVLVSYQELIDDPDIDAVYISLPNGLHYEWALKSLKAGKHVLLEKPSTSNEAEAISLFRHDILKQPNAPIILEAFHIRFHPAFSKFLPLLDSQNIESVKTIFDVPRGIIPNSDIRFIYDLAGGTLMDLGTYNVLCLRSIFGTEPEECVEALPRLVPKGFDQRCDHAMKASWRFPNGGIGSIEADLSASGVFGIPSMRFPRCEVIHKEKIVVADETLPTTEQHVVQRKVVFWNMVAPQVWHRIDIIDEHSIRSTADQKPVKSWTSKEYKKAYVWAEETRQPSEAAWSTYRHQLEQFVNRIKGREGSGVWFGGENSIKQMKMIDSAYQKAGLPLRPSSCQQL